MARNSRGVTVLIDKLLDHMTVEVEPFAMCVLSEGWRLRLPGPPTPLLHFVLEGSGTVSGAANDVRAFGSSWIAVVPPGAPHALATRGPIAHEVRIEAIPADRPICRMVAGSTDHPDLVVACGLVGVRYGESFDVFDRLPEVLAVDLSTAPHLRAVFQDILGEQERAYSGSTAMTKALMTQCLVHLFRSVPEDDVAMLPWLTALQDPRLADAVERILHDPAAPHTVESLADAAAMSRSAFADHFTHALGRPPMTLVHQVRMQHAAKLLADPALSVDTVAAKVGFSSRSHFSSAFKKHTGTTPARFRGAMG